MTDLFFIDPKLSIPTPEQNCHIPTFLFANGLHIKHTGDTLWIYPGIRVVGECRAWK